ncbi:hypothetical protein BC827DRAFT_1188540 [Russula dissimulans]|nr:hypothetical protein BC827DRAFT_1188540 [Russula dissimulans]
MYSDPSGKPSQTPATGSGPGPDHSQSASGYQHFPQGIPGLVQQNVRLPMYGGGPPRAWEGGGPSQQSIPYGPSTSPNGNGIFHSGQARSAGINFVAQQAQHPPIVAAYGNTPTIQSGPSPQGMQGPNEQRMYDEVWQTSACWTEYQSPQAMRLVILMKRV